MSILVISGHVCKEREQKSENGHEFGTTFPGSRFNRFNGNLVTTLKPNLVTTFKSIHEVAAQTAHAGILPPKTALHDTAKSQVLSSVRRVGARIEPSFGA